MVSLESKNTPEITCVCVCVCVRDSLLRELISRDLKGAARHGYSRLYTTQSQLSINLGVPYFIETQAFCDYYDSHFCNHGQLELRTIKTNSGNHHIVILPNANMLVHRDKAWSLNMLKQTKTNKNL